MKLCVMIIIMLMKYVCLLSLIPSVCSCYTNNTVWYDKKNTNTITSLAPKTMHSDMLAFLNVLSAVDENKTIATPDEIPDSVLPIAEIYCIRTRIIVEGQVISMIVGNKNVTGVWWARTPKEIKRDLDHAENIFNCVGLKFHVVEISYREYTSDFIDHFVDAMKYPKIMTVVYMMPKLFPFDGYSSGPWQKWNEGIIIGYSANEWTLAHEIGHYFGLLHTFGNDLVEDTTEQKKECSSKKGKTPNCGNIMNYCNHLPKMITKGQAERMIRFLRSMRADHIINDYEDILLNGQQFPVLSSIKIRKIH